MNDNASIFTNEEFGRIRTLLIEGEPWFVGKEVAASLGYVNTKDALRKHVDTEDKQVIQRSQLTTFDIPTRGLTIINESGLYALIFGSKLESAKRFKRWVTAEILPALHKTGIYSIEKKVPALLDIQELTTGDERILAYNRGIVLGVLRHELEEANTLEIYQRLSANGKGMVMKLIFGEVRS